jgi:hypothetical protein
MRRRELLKSAAAAAGSAPALILPKPATAQVVETPHKRGLSIREV